MKKGIIQGMALLLTQLLMSCNLINLNNVKGTDTVYVDSKQLEYKVDSSIDSTDSLENGELHTNQIEELYFPLPSKYINCISSKQGLRASIPNVNAGGGASISSFHDAIDIAVPDKTPVYAAKSGKIKEVYPSFYNGEIWKGHPTYGGYIEIIHSDNTSTSYAHLSFTEVKEGGLC